MKTLPTDIFLWQTKSVVLNLCCDSEFSRGHSFKLWNKMILKDFLPSKKEYRQPARLVTWHLFLPLLCSPTVPAWSYCSGGLSGHSRLLHRLADGEEGDWDQPLSAGHNGWRGRRLQLLGTSAGPPVPHLRAAQQGAHLGGSSVQAAC